MASKPNLVRNAPGLLHAVALVAPTREGTLRNIRRMARGTPPALYRPAIEIVLTVLRGAGHVWTPAEGYEWAKAQVKTIPDDDKRKCASEVVRALKPYLTTTAPQWIRPLSIEYYQAGPDLQIPVKLSGLMAIDGRFVVLVLHLWRKPLSIEQRQAAVAIVQNRLHQRPELADAELHFIDISVPQGHLDRQYRLATWETLTVMADDQLKTFTDRFYGAWTDYQANPEPKPQRKPRPSPYPDIFGDDPTDPRK
ncbi:MAG: hypothetical protein JWL84_5940 [Rhodospirillales bacterium]|nr:hypothetical protein [Rhodospirillales bacterium]